MWVQGRRIIRHLQPNNVQPESGDGGDELEGAEDADLGGKDGVEAAQTICQH